MTDIALVVLDTLRKDAFDRHFDWLPGKTFEQAYSPSHWTVPAHASIFTGAYASEIAIHAKNLYFDHDGPTLVEQLQRAGYTTRALSANPNISGHFDFDRGFEEFDSPAIQQPLNDDSLYDWRKLGREAEGPTDYLRGIAACVLGDSRTIPSFATLLSNAKNWREQGFYGVDSADWALDSIRETRFEDEEFLFVNLMDVHQPYEIPERYRTVDPPEMVPAIGDVAMGDLAEEQTRRAYDDASRYLSAMYEHIFEELAGEFDVVITLSDHGEMLGEQGVWGHEHGVYPQLTHVPLSIYGAGMSGRSELPVGLTDVYETVLSLAGIDHDGDGQDLTGTVEKRSYRTEYHGLTPWSKERLEDALEDGAVEEYDRALFGYVATDYYGYETPSGMREIGTLPEAGTLRERLEEIRAGTVSSTADRDIPDGVKSHLEQLGYR